MELKDILKTAEDGMKKAIEHCEIELSKIRSGRASTNLVDGVKVDYYGSMVPISQVSSISAPDATQIIVQPWEKNMLGPIEKSIQAANLGLNPTNDGTVIRLPIPPLTEERRVELAKMAKKVGEESKIGVRNMRREAMDALKRAEKDEHMSEDTRKGGEDDVQKLTDRYIAEVDRHVTAKEQEIMVV